MASCSNTDGQVSEKSCPKRKRKCCVFNCPYNVGASINAEGENISLFTFPRCHNAEQKKRCQKWVKNCANPVLNEKDMHTYHNHLFICGRHFTYDQFSNTRHNRLNNNAVPIIFSDGGRKEPDTGSDSEGEALRESGNEAHEPLEDDSRRNSFEDMMSSLNWHVCSNCNERTMFFSGERGKCSHGSKCGQFSHTNNMDPGPIPAELSGLSFIEEQLMARVHPIISVFKLKGLQFGYAGNIINFHQDVSNFAKQLPHKVQDLKSVLAIKRHDFEDTGNLFHVRAPKVLCALIWLKRHNEFYKDIEISDSNLNMLPSNGSVFEQVISVCESRESETSLQAETVTETDKTTKLGHAVDSSDTENLFEACLPCIAVPSVDEQVRSNLYDWPKFSTEPLNEFTTIGYIVCAFPALFPFGKADLKEDRPHKIENAQYFRHLLKYKDGRFACHQTFRYFCFNSWMRWSAMSNGRLFIRNNPEFAKMTVSSLKSHIEEQPNILKKLMFQGSNLRGTKAYWSARCKDLISMVEQLGLPTAFITFSCADLHWPKLFGLLTDNGDLESLTEKERRDLLQKKPLTVDEFFSKRVDCFIKTVLQEQFKLKDYWYRIEYQARGSPHVHGIYWFENAPDMKNICSADEETIKEAVQYFDSLVHAMIPVPDCEKPNTHPCRKTFKEVIDQDEDLSQLLFTVQKHRCSTDYCLRRDKTTKKVECRFKFPIEMRSSSDLVVNKSGKPEFLPARNDELLNKYNDTMLKVWRANMDISPVVSQEALLQYLAKYVSKCEVKSKPFKELLTLILEEADDDDNIKRSIGRVFLKTCAERDYSAQEVCHILSGSKLFSAGKRSFVYCNLGQSKDWIEVQKNTDEDISVKKKTLLERYTERPEEFENLTLWNALKSHDVKKWTRKRKENIVRIFPRLELSYDADKNMEYFRQKVLLHSVWRSEDQLQKEFSWEQLYMNLNMDRSADKGISLENISDVESEYDSDADHEPLEDWMIVSQFGPNKKSPSVELGFREIDRQYDWQQDAEKYATYGTFEDFKNFIKDKKIADQSPDWSSDIPAVSFSKEQSGVITLMNQQIDFIKSNVTVPSPEPVKRVLIQGKAGCGKSLVVKYLTGSLDHQFEEKAYLLLAPTGVAAVNIGGETVHSALKIPVKKSNDFKELTGEAARKFADVMENKHFLIIDEYSMLGCNMLAKIDQRCRQGKGSSEPFGGLFLYLLGDIRQLPPVKDSPLYSTTGHGELYENGKAAVQSIQSVFFLSQSFRQKDPEFEQLLDRLSTGDSTYDDYLVLRSRFNKKSVFHDQDSFDEEIHLFATKQEVINYNMQKLGSLKDINNSPVPVARVAAKHNCRAAARASSDEAEGLSSVLYLAKGCKVMLRSNLWTKMGLVNGSIGQVVDIVYDSSDQVNSFPEVIMCRFKKYKGPGIGPNDDILPIPSVTRAWVNTRGENCTRISFPLVPCYACSIHKSQGLTLEKAGINIGNIEFALGLTYVALSRVKSIAGLSLAPFEFKRLSKLKSSNSMKLRKQFEEQLAQLTTINSKGELAAVKNML